METNLGSYPLALTADSARQAHGSSPSGDYAEDAVEIRRLLALPIPIYFEDDQEGMGHCVVCGKKGCLGRCSSCGLLVHVGCLGVPASDEARARACSLETHHTTFDLCPRCAAAPLPEPEPTSRFGIGRHKYDNKYLKGTLVPLRAGREDGLETRAPCRLDGDPPIS